MGLGPNWYQIGNKTCYIPKVRKFYVEKKMSMLSGLKVSFLACKCAFYRPEHNVRWDPIELNFEGLEMKKRNVPTDKSSKSRWEK